RLHSLRGRRWLWGGGRRFFRRLRIHRAWTLRISAGEQSSEQEQCGNDFHCILLERSELICPHWRLVENPPKQQLNCRYNNSNNRACVTDAARRITAGLW